MRETSITILNECEGSISVVRGAGKVATEVIFHFVGVCEIKSVNSSHMVDNPLG